jgi:CheY-like chemotaxis protein
MPQRILVIEDEFLVALEIMSVLDSAGFRNIQHVDNEAEAIQRVAEEEWDGVVADVNLYERSIEGVATALHQRSIPFIVVTGYSKQSLPVAIGRVPIIEKPFYGPNLAASLISVCRFGPGCPRDLSSTRSPAS